MIANAAGDWIVGKHGPVPGPSCTPEANKKAGSGSAFFFFTAFFA